MLQRTFSLQCSDGYVGILSDQVRVITFIISIQFAYVQRLSPRPWILSWLLHLSQEQPIYILLDIRQRLRTKIRFILLHVRSCTNMFLCKIVIDSKIFTISGLMVVPLRHDHALARASRFNS